MRNITPEIRLWQAVLIRAALDWKGEALRGNVSKELQDFFFDDPAGFEEICDTVSIRPAKIRACLTTKNTGLMNLRVRRSGLL